MNVFLLSNAKIISNYLLNKTDILLKIIAQLHFSFYLCTDFQTIFPLNDETD